MDFTRDAKQLNATGRQLLGNKKTGTQTQHSATQMQQSYIQSVRATSMTQLDYQKTVSQGQMAQRPWGGIFPPLAQGITSHNVLTTVKRLLECPSTASPARPMRSRQASRSGVVQLGEGARPLVANCEAAACFRCLTTMPCSVRRHIASFSSVHPCSFPQHLPAITLHTLLHLALSVHPSSARRSAVMIFET